jgi:nicotinate-nucleotide adenylyltransferase
MLKNDKNILIYGGAFNPPTVAHAAIIDSALSENQFSEIWLMPSKDRSDKVIGVPDSLRVKMLETLIEECFYQYKHRIGISRFELNLPGKTETYETMQLLAHEYPNLNFTWLIGADSWLTMPKWEHGAELVKDGHWLIIDREGYPLGTLPSNARVIKSLFSTCLSSTVVRQRVSDNLSAMPYVVKGVDKIITKNSLYKH